MAVGSWFTATPRALLRWRGPNRTVKLPVLESQTPNCKDLASCSTECLKTCPEISNFSGWGTLLSRVTGKQEGTDYFSFADQPLGIIDETNCKSCGAYSSRVSLLQ